MDKDEILAQSRKENKYKDLHEEELRLKASSIGGIAATILATVFFLAQVMLDEGMNFGLYAIAFCVSAANYTYRAVLLKSRHDVFMAAVCIFFVVSFSVKHLIDLLSASNIL